MIPKFYNFNSFDTGFIVGILEGEGCFRYTTGRNNTSVCVTISINMSDIDVIKKICKLLKINKIYSYDPNKYKKFNKPAKMMHQIELRGIKAIEILKIIYPFMSKRRREKIRDILKRVKFQKKFLIKGKYFYI